MTDPNIAKFPLRTLAAWASHVLRYTITVPTPDTFIITAIPTPIPQDPDGWLLRPPERQP